MRSHSLGISTGGPDFHGYGLGWKEVMMILIQDKTLSEEIYNYVWNLYWFVAYLIAHCQGMIWGGLGGSNKTEENFASMDYAVYR